MSASGLIVFRLFFRPPHGGGTCLARGESACRVRRLLRHHSSRQFSRFPAREHRHRLFRGRRPVRAVTPLDGEILLNGASLAVRRCGHPRAYAVFSGLTCMAWSEPGEPADAWRQVASGLQERRSVQERPEPAEPQREEPVMDLGDPMILLEEGTSVGANGVGKTLWERLRSLPPAEDWPCPFFFCWACAG